MTKTPDLRKTNPDQHLRNAGGRLWNSGGLNERGVRTWCRDNDLTERQTELVLEGWRLAVRTRDAAGFNR
jgi:hypothetical protein